MKNRNILASTIEAQAWNAATSCKNVEQWLASAINTANTTVYDKAIDSVYLSTHIGGSQLHHLLDGQHDIIGAFKSASNALPDDSLMSEIYGTANHLLKDLFSVSGLPIISIEPDTYRETSTWISKHLGISKSWQADLLQINAIDLLGGSLSLASAIFALKKDDKKLLSEIGASSLLVGIGTANPIALVASIVAIAYSIKKRSNNRDSLEGTAKGIGSTSVVYAIGAICVPLASSVLSSILLLVVSVILASLVRNFIGQKFSDKNIDNTENEKRWNNHLLIEEDKIKKKFSPELVNALAKATS